MKSKKLTFEGKLVRLRPMDKQKDLETAWQFINDPEITHYLATILPITREQEEVWFDRIGKSDEHIVFAIETLDGEYIGNIGLHRIDWKTGIAYTGTVIGNKKYWNGGYGTDAKMILLAYAFYTLGLRKICSEVYEYNMRSVNYSLRCGYKQEGRLRKHMFRMGKFWDKFLLGVFRHEWEPIYKLYKKTGSVR